jgi:hypothetical protein
MERVIIQKLKDLTVTMMTENVNEYNAWLNIRIAIDKLCESLEGAVSHEKWISTITEINKIRKRVEDLKVANRLWSAIKRELDGCVEMITEHERGKSALDVSNMLHELKMLGSCKSYIFAYKLCDFV